MFLSVGVRTLRKWVCSLWQNSAVTCVLYGKLYSTCKQDDVYINNNDNVTPKGLLDCALRSETLRGRPFATKMHWSPMGFPLVNIILYACPMHLSSPVHIFFQHYFPPFWLHTSTIFLFSHFWCKTVVGVASLSKAQKSCCSRKCNVVLRTLPWGRHSYVNTSDSVREVRAQ